MHRERGRRIIGFEYCHGLAMCSAVALQWRGNVRKLQLLRYSRTPGRHRDVSCGQGGRNRIGSPLDIWAAHLAADYVFAYIWCLGSE